MNNNELLIKLKNDPRITLRELLCFIKENSIGIPHFQRGLVWNNEMKNKIFDSLFLKTPINTILLWKPINPGNHGRGILGEKNNPAFFLLDGQQRITTIYEQMEKAEAFLDSEITFSRESKSRNQLCFNIKNYNNIIVQKLYGSQGTNKNLFIIASKKGKTESSFEADLIPINVIMRGLDIRGLEGINFSITENLVHKQLNSVFLEVREKLIQMLDSRIFVQVLEENETEHSLPQVLDTYIRINSAGVKVIEHEKLFAVLAGAGAEIRTLFENIHDNAARVNSLERIREGKFGFKAFMEIFSLVFHFHFGSEKDFTMERTLSEIMVIVQNPKGRKSVVNLWENTCQIINYLASQSNGLLRSPDGLYFDDLRFFPDKALASLLPLIMLFIAYPSFMDNEHRILHLELALILLLNKNDYSLKNKRQIGFLQDIWKKELSLSVKSILKLGNGLEQKLIQRFNEITTVQNYYVDLLYILERKNRALDISMLNLEERATNIKKYFSTLVDNPETILIEKIIMPAKQHIVPAAKFDRDRKNPLSNNIGNITYISSKINAWDALSHTAMNLTFEIGRKYNVNDNDNFSNHFFSTDFAELYDKVKLKDRILDSDESCRKLFYIRNNSIAKGWEIWLDQYRKQNTLKVAELSINEFRYPASREFSNIDEVRGKILQFNPKIEGFNQLRVQCTESVYIIINNARNNKGLIAIDIVGNFNGHIAKNHFYSCLKIVSSKFSSIKLKARRRTSTVGALLDVEEIDRCIRNLKNAIKTIEVTSTIIEKLAIGKFEHFDSNCKDGRFGFFAKSGEQKRGIFFGAKINDQGIALYAFIETEKKSDQEFRDAIHAKNRIRPNEDFRLNFKESWQIIDRERICLDLDSSVMKKWYHECQEYFSYLLT